MKWVVTNFSRNEVRRAGEVLIDDDSNEDEVLRSMEVLSNWRAAHAYPMHAILTFLRKKSDDLDKSAIVVQRLKRTPSIIRKLKRYNQMKLHRMQDISGCRSVVKTVEVAEKLAENIINSRTRHVLHKVDDYVKNPKSSGYRCIHLIYKYNGEKEEYKDYFVEIQIRSRIQHAWATAIEIIDTYTRQALKASQGQQDWLNFFRYVSAEFSKLESRPIVEDLSRADTLPRLISLEGKLNAINRLQAFAVTTKHISKQKNNKSDFFLLGIDQKANLIEISQYSADKLDEATKKYLECENRARHESGYDAVLVAAQSLHELREAYPNYFADSRDFISYVNMVIGKS